MKVVLEATGQRGIDVILDMVARRVHAPEHRRGRDRTGASP